MVVFLQQMNVSIPTAIITGLEKGGRYNIFVVARNKHGTSLPSSILMITISKPGESSGGPFTNVVLVQTVQQW